MKSRYARQGESSSYRFLSKIEALQDRFEKPQLLLETSLAVFAAALRLLFTVVPVSVVPASLLGVFFYSLECQHPRCSLFSLRLEECPFRTQNLKFNGWSHLTVSGQMRSSSAVKFAPLGRWDAPAARLLPPR